MTLGPFFALVPGTLNACPNLVNPNLLLSQAGSDDLDRKRAVHLLQQLLTHHTAPQLNAWTTFLALHGALDEFAFNMVLPVWKHQVGEVLIEILR